MSNLKPVEIKAFVPAVEFDTSKRFYEALGFEVPFSDGELAYVRYQETSFLLQAYPEREFACHYQMHLLVENVDDWHGHVMSSGVVDTFGVAVGVPQDQPWAMRDFTVVDPSGVLWRIAQNIPQG